MIACSTNDSVHIICSKTGTTHRKLKCSPSAHYSSLLSCTSLDKLIVPQNSNKCIYFYKSTGQKSNSRCFTTAFIISLAKSDCDTYIVGGSKEGYVYLWNLMNSNLLGVTKGHQQSVVASAFHPNSSLFATCGLDSMCKVWTIGGNSLGIAPMNSHNSDQAGIFYPRSSFSGHTLSVTACKFFNYKRAAASTSLDETFKVFNFDTGIELLSIQLYIPCTSFLLSTDNQNALVGTNNGTVFSINLEGQNGINNPSVPLNSMLNPHKASIIALFMVDNATLISASSDGIIAKWESRFIKNELKYTTEWLYKSEIWKVPTNFQLFSCIPFNVSGISQNEGQNSSKMTSELKKIYIAV